MSRNQGLTEQKIGALPDYATSPAFTELERLCLTYTDHMTQTPVSVSDDLFARLTEHLDPAQLVELTSMVAWENYRARFNHALSIGSDNFSEGMACPIPVRLPDRLSHHEEAA